MDFKNKVQEQIYDIIYLNRPQSFTAEKLSIMTGFSVRRIKYNATKLIKKDIGFEEEMNCNSGYCYSLGYYFLDKANIKEPHIVLLDYLKNNMEISVIDYAYTIYENKNGKHKAIEVDVNKDDYGNMRGQKIITDGFIFNRTLMGKQVRENIYTFIFTYKLQENIDISSDIKGKGKKYGVIAPDGKFYECDYMGHNNLEYFLNSRNLIGDSPIYGVNPFEYFGWVKLTGASFTECEFVFQYKSTKWDSKTKEDIILKENILTDAQIKTIKNYFVGKDRKYINFNYMWYKIEDIDDVLRNDADTEYRYIKGEYDIENSREELKK